MCFASLEETKSERLVLRQTGALKRQQHVFSKKTYTYVEKTRAHTSVQAYSFCIEQKGFLPL